jgi:hypothetical protein
VIFPHTDILSETLRNAPEPALPTVTIAGMAFGTETFHAGQLEPVLPVIKGIC